MPLSVLHSFAGYSIYKVTKKRVPKIARSRGAAPTAQHRSTKRPTKRRLAPGFAGLEARLHGEME